MTNTNNAENESPDQAPLACILTPGTYQERLSWLAQIGRDGLRSHQRRDLVLDLRYSPEIADRVREMVEKEQQCCAFLTFALSEDESEIRLTITAPERARGAADLLFAQFVPALGEERRA